MINEWKEILADCMDQHLAKIIISGPRKKDSVRKIEIRPVLLKEQLVFQASAYTEKQVQHYNLTEEEVYEKVAGLDGRISAIGSPSSEKTGAGSGQ